MVKLPYDPNSILPPDVPVDQQVIGSNQPVLPAEKIAPAPVPQEPLQNQGIKNFFSGMFGQDSDPNDPYANLSKTQKRMLAFAAISDAGAALKGQQGTMVKDTLSDFTRRADQKRKAEAARMQQEAIERMTGIGAGLGGFDTTTVEGIDQAISALGNFAISNPSLASGIGLKIKQLEASKAELMSEQATVEQGEFLFPKITDAINFVNPNGLIDEETGEPIINPNIATRIARGGSEWLQTQEYQEFKGNLNTIKNNYTFENMVKLKKQGVTFGALSENELRQVSELVGQLDPANPKGTLATLSEIRGFINLDRERRGLPPLDASSSGEGPLTWDPENGWG